jgi:hypothetical protein
MEADMSDGSKSRTSHQGERARGSRVGNIVKQQEEAILSFAAFVDKAADMSLKGNCSPCQLVKAYADLWRDWAKQFSEITREILRD